MNKPLFQDYKTPQDYINKGIIPIEPMLAKEEGREKNLREMFKSADYLAEDKLDGVRATLHIFKDHIRVFSRRISKKTGWYAENSDLVPHIRDIAIPELEGTIIDAELVMPSGIFKDIASTMNCNWDKAIERQEELGLVQVKAFDIIYYKGESLEKKELHIRKGLLKIVIDILDEDFIGEISYFDMFRAVVIDTETRGKIYENKEIYPTVYREIMLDCGKDNQKALRTNIFQLSKEAYYEYYVIKGGEGIILKDKFGLYRQTRGREYTKVKKFTTKDVVVIGYTPPTREYKGKYTNTWTYWENPITQEKYDITKEELPEGFRSSLDPITKYHYEDWIGTIQYGVAVTEEDLETWKKINPKEKVNVVEIDDTMYLDVGETSGLTEEERIEFSENREEYIGTVIEVKCHEVIQKTGRLRHPRYLRHRFDRAPESCTIIDHLGGK